MEGKRRDGMGSPEQKSWLQPGKNDDDQLLFNSHAASIQSSYCPCSLHIAVFNR